MDLAPLRRLRLRTPRLELRLPADDELTELRELARAGVHAPEEMPFAYPWTDEPYSEHWVVRFHEERLATWTPETWELNLAVWAEGSLAGVQGIGGRDFARRRVVGTGSWLGHAFQGRGYGTEMRAAVLELAFRGLGARVARSAALDGNEASLRVSEKLAYRVVGRSTAAPRGAEVGQTELELRRDEWNPPVAVEITGLNGCLALFGLAAA